MKKYYKNLMPIIFLVLLIFLPTASNALTCSVTVNNTKISGQGETKEDAWSQMAEKCFDILIIKYYDKGIDIIDFCANLKCSKE